MAGSDKKLSEFIPSAITDPSGGYFHIIKPDGSGGYESKAISEEYVTPTSNRTTDKLVNQSASFTKAFDAGTILERISFAHVSGSPLIKVGTTLDGTEISLAEMSVPSGDYLVLVPNKIFSGTTTVYITISGGTVNVNFDYITNYF